MKISKKRLLIVTTSLEESSGGIATNNVNLISALHNRYQVNIFNFNIKNNGVSLYNKLKLIFYLIFAFRYDLLIFDHVNLARVSLLFPKLYILSKALILAHGSESYFSMSPIDRFLFRRCKLVVCNSQLTRLRHIAWGGQAAATTCLLGASSQKVPKNFVKKSYTKGKFKLLIVARIDKREGKKGHSELMNALQKLPSDITLTIVGEGSGMSDLVKQSNELNISERVLFTGRIKDDELRQVYSDHNLLVMPSRQEGFGLVFVEAMAWGIPAIGCQSDAAQEIILDGSSGRLISNKVLTSELVDSILEIRRDYSVYSYNARLRYEKKFSFCSYKKRIQGVLEIINV